MSRKPEGERLVMLEVLVKDMRSRLFGIDGDSGLIGALTERMQEMERRVSKLTWILVGVYMGWAFLTSNGVVSLASVLKAMETAK
jgi:hypothetical protein